MRYSCSTYAAIELFSSALLVLDELAERVEEVLRVRVRAGDQIVEDGAERVDVGGAADALHDATRTLISLVSANGRLSRSRLRARSAAAIEYMLVAVEQRERVVLDDVDVEVLEELDLGRAPASR